MIPSPEDFENGSRLIDPLIQLAKWIGGTVAAAYLAGKWLLRQGVRVGEEKQKYEDLISAVDKINALDLETLIRTVAEMKAASPYWMTRKEHDEIRTHCRLEIESMVSQRMYKAVMEWRDEVAALNANVCHIMGALNLRPVDSGKKRRVTDLEDGD